MAQTYFVTLTDAGEAKLANAAALGMQVKFAHMALGDGNGATPIPDRQQKALVHEVRRAPLNTLSVDPKNPSQVIAEQVIPEDVGGWWIRELGLYDEAGVLCAVANCPPTYKPMLAEGSGRNQIVRMVLLVASTDAVTLKIDPAVVLATREYCDNAVAVAISQLDSKQSVRAATTTAIELSGLKRIDGVSLIVGERVLVRNQAAGKDNGIYVVSAGAWTRSSDADAALEVTPGMLIPVEEGATNGDAVFQLVTAAPVTLGTTALAFERVTGKTGVSAGTYRSVTVDTCGRVTGGTNPTTLDGYGITADVQALVDATRQRDAGRIAFFARPTAPPGWLKANGAAVSRMAYAALFDAIGTTFGAGDGKSTFNLPDLRGEFVRGWDDGRGLDNGRAFATAQVHAIQSHAHVVPAVDVTNPNSSFINQDHTGDSLAATDNVEAINSFPQPNRYLTHATGSSETRPRNIALLACIQY
ncbi:phage tail protein [Trinickia sp. LjRoot230]|uniref:phage tail-collar fiber domain-containing protein n=1 Tax=Trinickia sp. LjRoot230 TaxID=3342288 RepID=UPI003ECDA239